MRLREDHTPPPKVYERPAPNFRNQSAGSPQPVRRKAPQHHAVPHIGGIVGPTPVPLGQDAQTQAFIAPRVTAVAARAHFTDPFSSVERPGPRFGAHRITPVQLLNVHPQPPDPYFRNAHGDIAPHVGNADSSAYAGAAYLKYQADLRLAAFKRDAEAMAFNPTRGANPPQTEGNVARFDQDISKNPLMKQILDDPVHGHDMIQAASAMGLPLPDSVIRRYSKEIIDGLKMGIIKPDEIPNIVLPNNQEGPIRFIQSRVEAMGYSKSEVLKMNFGELAQAAAGRGKYRSVSGPFGVLKGLPGTRFIPTAAHNLPADFIANTIGLVPAAAYGGSAFVRDVAGGLSQAKYAATGGGGKAPDSSFFPNTTAYAKDMAQGQVQFLKNLYNDPVGTAQQAPLSTGLLGWSLLHGAAGGLGRLGPLQRTMRYRRVKIGNYTNTGEGGIRTHSLHPDQLGLPGIDPNMFVDPTRGPTPGLPSPPGGPTAGAPHVHERQARLEGFSGATDKGGKAVWDEQLARQEFSKRTGRHMTADEVAAAKREFEFTHGITKRIDLTGRMSHADAQREADILRRHVEEQQARIDEVQQAREREAALMQGNLSRDFHPRIAERKQALDALHVQRNTLAAQVYEHEQNLQAPRDLPRINSQIEQHNAEIASLKQKLDAGANPTLEASMRKMIDTHEEAIKGLIKQKSGVREADNIARQHIDTLKSKLADINDAITHEHIDLNIPAPHVTKRIPDMRAALAEAQRRGAPPEQLARMRTQIVKAESLGATDPYEPFYHMTRNITPDAFEVPGLRDHPFIDDHPVDVAKRIWNEKLRNEGHVDGAYMGSKDATDRLVNRMDQALTAAEDAAYYGTRSVAGVNVQAGVQAAEEVFGPNWHNAIFGNSKHEQLQIAEFLQNLQRKIVDQYHEDVQVENNANPPANVNVEFGQARDEKIKAADLAEQRRQNDIQAARFTHGGRSTPEEIAPLRRAGLGKSNIISREGNVIEGRFPAKDPEGHFNPKLQTPHQVRTMVNDLYLHRNTEVADLYRRDPGTLMQLSNRLQGIEDLKRGKINEIEDAIYKQGYDNPASHLQIQALAKLQDDLYIASMARARAQMLLGELALEDPRYLPYARASTKNELSYNPNDVQVDKKFYYHGTRTRGLTPDALDPYKTDVGNLFGPGFYSTDAIGLSDTYAMNHGGHGVVYEVRIDPNHKNFIDLEKPLPADAAQVFINVAEDMDNWLENNPTTGTFRGRRRVTNTIERMIQDGDPGKDIYQAFSNHLLGGMLDSHIEHGFAHRLRRDLMAAGYDGYQHISGFWAGGWGHSHVVIFFDPATSIAEMGDAKGLAAPSAAAEADRVRRIAAGENPDAGTALEPYRDRLPVPQKRELVPTGEKLNFGDNAKARAADSTNRDTLGVFNRNARDAEAAKAIHGNDPPKPIAPAPNSLVKSEAITGSALKNIEDPLYVYRLPYSKNLIDRAVEWIDDKILESTNPNHREYQDRFLRNRYATEQGHVRRAFYMWREDLGPLLDAAKKVTTEEGMAVTGALAQGVSIDHMVRFYRKLIDMENELSKRANFPQELKDRLLSNIPDDATLARVQKFAEDNNMPQHAKALSDFRRYIKNADYVDDGLFGAYISSWWEPSLDLRKQLKLWENIQERVPETTPQMQALLEEMRKASAGVDNMIEAAGVLPRHIMDNRRYQRQNIVSAVLGEVIPLDDKAVYVPDRQTVVAPGEYLMRRSRRYDPGAVWGGRLKRHHGRLLIQGKVNPTFSSYYTGLTSAKSKIEAVRLQRHILTAYAHRVPYDQTTYDANRFYLYNGRTGVKWDPKTVGLRKILDEFNKQMGSTEEQQYGLAHMENRTDLLNFRSNKPFHKSVDIQRLTDEEIANAHRGDMYLVPKPIMESVLGQITFRQPRGRAWRIAQKMTNWWRTLVLKLRPAYLPVNIAESAGRAGLYGGVGPLSYTRTLRLNKRMQNVIDPKSGRSYRELGTDPLHDIMPDWLLRTTFTGDITSSLHLGSQDVPFAEKRRAIRDMFVKGGREVRSLPGGPLVLDTGKFVLGGYGDYVFRATAEGENLMRAAHVTKRLLQEARNQKYAGRWWHPGRYTDRLDENMFHAMKKIAKGEDISSGAAMDEILRDTARLLGDFSKAHKAGLGIAIPFYRWVAFIAKFTLMEAMYRRPGRAYLYGALSKMSWQQLQSLGLLPQNIAGAIPLGQLEQQDAKDPATGQRDKLLSVLYTQAWNGPITLVNAVGLDPGTAKFHPLEGAIKQVNPLGQLIFAAAALRDPASLRDLKGPHNEPLDRTDIFGTFGKIMVAQFARQLWPVMLGQNYSEMADTSIPYLDEVKKDANPQGQPQSSTGEKLFALITGLRRRKLDLTKAQMATIKTMQSEVQAHFDALQGDTPKGTFSPAQKKYLADAQKDYADLIDAAKVWYQTYHTDPFNTGQVLPGLPVPPIGSTDSEDAFNKAQQGLAPPTTGYDSEDAFNKANR